MPEPYVNCDDCGERFTGHTAIVEQTVELFIETPWDKHKWVVLCNDCWKKRGKPNGTRSSKRN
jgi:hypothetical protein